MNKKTYMKPKTRAVLVEPICMLAASGPATQDTIEGVPGTQDLDIIIPDKDGEKGDDEWYKGVVF